MHGDLSQSSIALSRESIPMAYGQDRLMKYGFIAPAILLLIAMNVFPLFYSIYLSFTDATLSGNALSFNGLCNYRQIFAETTDNRYADAIRLTAKFVFWAVALELLIGYTLALALRDRFPGKAVILTIFLVPMMLSPAVMGLFANLLFNEQFGVLNRTLETVGISNPPHWLTGADVKFWTILLIDIWMWTPFMLLIAMAALHSIPRHIYEAAAIDRASRWTVFRRITLPMSAPLLGLAALLRTTDALKQFDYVMAVTGSNDPATQTLSTLLYQIIFKNFKTGLGCAYACIILVVVIALASVFIRYIDHLQQNRGRA